LRKISLNISSNRWHLILLTVIGSIAFFPFLGSVHLFDWDEINFAEAAREMMVTGNYSQVQINFQPFYEKPPLFFWLQVLSMKLWGINEFAARFPNAIFGVVTLLTIYLAGKDYKNSRLGLFWSLMHLSALLPHFYFKTGIIDPVFNYFIFVGIFCLTKLMDRTDGHTMLWSLLGGMTVGLATLTKGPVGLLLPALTVIAYWIRGNCNPIISWQPLILFILTSLLIPLFWFGYETYQNGLGFIKAFLIYQLQLFNRPVAGHGQPFYYHFIVVFLGCFPASILALGKLFKTVEGKDNLFSLMKMLFWVVMLLFSIATTKIVHYSSLAYFPISFLAANYLYSLEQKRNIPSPAIHILFITIGTLIATLLVALPIIAIYKKYLYSYIKDEFTLACVSLPVPWRLSDCCVGVSYLLLMAIAYYSLKRYTLLYFSGWCSIATTVCLMLGTILIVPKIEMHTQAPAIEFYKSLVGQPAYVTTVDFKSYAPFFYFRQPKETAITVKQLTGLLSEELDKPAYFVVKINDKYKLESYPDIVFLKAEGGFALFKRHKL
jgi:4-amino-4-deoxy-L-arabinose transferase-like glycosyltransferase